MLSSTSANTSISNWNSRELFYVNELNTINLKVRHSSFFNQFVNVLSRNSLTCCIVFDST